MPVLSDGTWEARCVLCAARDRTTTLKHGHVCHNCGAALRDALRSILDHCCDAAAYVAPTRGGGHGGSYESSPPIDCDAVDPAGATARTFTDQDPDHVPRVLEVLEEWERMIRDMRHLAPYGAVTESLPRHDAFRDQATLTHVTTFLAAHLDWAVTDIAFPIEDFDHEVRACLGAVRRWDRRGSEDALVVHCPSVLDDGSACGRRLRLRTTYAADPRFDRIQTVWCPACGATRQPEQLLAAAGIDEMFLPAALIAGQLDVPEGTVRTWAIQGRVRRQNHRFHFGDVLTLARARATRRASNA